MSSTGRDRHRISDGEQTNLESAFFFCRRVKEESSHDQNEKKYRSRFKLLFVSYREHRLAPSTSTTLNGTLNLPLTDAYLTEGA